MNRPQFSLKMLLWLTLMVALSPILCAGLAILVLQLRSGIKVTIKNTGQAKIRSVMLHVTGNSYSLGDLDPGESKEATVKSTGDSSLEIEFVDEAGNNQRLNAGGYFEPGYRGTICVSIKDGTIDTNEQQVNSY